MLVSVRSVATVSVSGRACTSLRSLAWSCCCPSSRASVLAVPAGSFVCALSSSAGGGSWPVGLVGVSLPTSSRRPLRCSAAGLPASGWFAGDWLWVSGCSLLIVLLSVLRRRRFPGVGRIGIGIGPWLLLVLRSRPHPAHWPR